MSTHEFPARPIPGGSADVQLGASAPVVRASDGSRPRMIRHAWVRLAAATTSSPAVPPSHVGDDRAIDGRRAA
jgi:hypothetical protein